mmetsp:Transcript_51232/g.111169  ORF Transcript_51232/g.111169 Transcript_51232/m.111169 type:complete len:359 (+) Transcript_51232:675-1751(+)
MTASAAITMKSASEILSQKFTYASWIDILPSNSPLKRHSGSPPLSSSSMSVQPSDPPWPFRKSMKSWPAMRRMQPPRSAAGQSSEVQVSGTIRKRSLTLWIALSYNCSVMQRVVICAGLGQDIIHCGLLKLCFRIFFRMTASWDAGSVSEQTSKLRQTPVEPSAATISAKAQRLWLRHCCPHWSTVSPDVVFITVCWALATHKLPTSKGRTILPVVPARVEVVVVIEVAAILVVAFPEVVVPTNTFLYMVVPASFFLPVHCEKDVHPPMEVCLANLQVLFARHLSRHTAAVSPFPRSSFLEVSPEAHFAFTKWTCISSGIWSSFQCKAATKLSCEKNATKSIESIAIAMKRSTEVFRF